MIRSGMPLAATARSLPLLQEASNSPGMINVTARQTGYRLNISPPFPSPRLMLAWILAACHQDRPPSPC